MFVTVVMFLLFFHPTYQWRTIYDRIMEESEFSGYRNLIKGNRVATIDLLYSGITIFVPENEAIERHDGFLTEDVVLYHLATETYTLKELRLNSTIGCVFEHNPPIWVSVVEGDEYYLNNAKIVEAKSNYVAKCKRNQGLKQVLHVIDRLLDPKLAVPFATPSAHDFLQHHQNWNLGFRKVSNFFKRVQFHEKEDLYKKSGGHTFFVPIDDTRHDHRFQDIDTYVIQSHVVPDLVLFTRPTRRNFIFETAANDGYIDIVLCLVTQNGRDYVKSYTVLGNSEHPKGEILAEIVKGNIPVTNGVVHLISQPLAVFDRKLKPFPYLQVWYKISADPDLSITHRVSKSGRVGNVLKEGRGMFTFFAPKNPSWEGYRGYGLEEKADFLSRHVIVSEWRHTMSTLAISSAKNSGTILETLGGSLRINVIYTNGSYWLIWGETAIKVSRPDYECSDGIVHIIDGVLAAPRDLPAAARQERQEEASFWKMLKNLVT